VHWKCKFKAEDTRKLTVFENDCLRAGWKETLDKTNKRREEAKRDD